MDIGGSKDRAHIWSYQNDGKKALIEAKKNTWSECPTSVDWRLQVHVAQVIPGDCECEHVERVEVHVARALRGFHSFPAT